MANNFSSERTFRQALERAREILATSPELVASGVVETEAEQFALAALRHESGAIVSRLEFFSNPARPFPGSALVLLEEWCRERVAGRPLQHLTGYQAFLDHEYEVGPEVLVPRPETEALTLEALEVLKQASPKLGIEIGLGSGVISIELLCALPALHLYASEVSPRAADCALRNAARIMGSNWHKRLRVLPAMAASDVWGAFHGALPRKVDFLISNPPYLSSADEVEKQVLLNEPHEALFPPNPAEGGSDSLHFYREISKHAKEWVRPGGWVFLEIPHERAREISALFTTEQMTARIHKDLTGRGRVLVAQLS